MDFGRVWGGFWEAKIFDFRTFFVIFSMQNLECNLEGQEIEKKKPQDNRFPLLGAGSAVIWRLLGRKKKRGSRA